MRPETKLAFEKSLRFFQLMSLPEDISGIKKQYRKLALQYHPDHSGEASGAKFRALGEHYTFLTDNYHEYRRLYPPPRPSKPRKVLKGNRIFRVLASERTEHTIAVPDDLLSNGDAVLCFIWRDREYQTLIPHDFDLETSYLQNENLRLSFRKEYVW